jgi:hypothetical protein
MMILYSLLYRSLGLIRFFCKLAIWIFAVRSLLMFASGLVAGDVLAHVSAYTRSLMSLLVAVAVLHLTDRMKWLPKKPVVEVAPEKTSG